MTSVTRRSCILILAACALPLWVTQGCDGAGKTEVGRKAPEFSYLDLEGKTRRLSDSRGRVVMLRFWADWCPPCAAEFPIIEKVYREMNGKGLDVIAVNVRQSEVKVKEYVRKFELSHTVALDQDGRISKRYDIKGIPINFIIDQEGIIRGVVKGTISDAAMLQQFLAPHL
jgi:peroxiredoxin